MRSPPPPARAPIPARSADAPRGGGTAGATATPPAAAPPPSRASRARPAARRGCGRPLRPSAGPLHPGRGGRAAARRETIPRRAPVSPADDMPSCPSYLVFELLAEPVVGAMHSHLQRRHGPTDPLRDLLVRQSVHVLQDEHLALLRRQLHQGALDRAAPFTILHRPIGAFHRGDGEVAILDHPRRAEPRLAPPLGEAPVSQDQEEPPREILRVAALRELIE